MGRRVENPLEVLIDRAVQHALLGVTRSIAGHAETHYHDAELSSCSLLTAEAYGVELIEDERAITRRLRTCGQAAVQEASPGFQSRPTDV